MKKTISKVLAVVVVAASTSFIGAAPVDAKAQSAKWKVTGACLEDADYSSYYMYEKYESSCYVTVTLTPKAPMRRVRLQYWDEEDGKWYNERTAMVRKGSIRFRIRADNCYDEFDARVYCEGEYEYRIVVDAAKGQRRLVSKGFIVTMVPIFSSDDYSDY